MRPSNYDLQAQAAGHSFAAQDLDAIAARFALRRDETYLYLELLHEPLRLSRTDGAAERQHDGVWMPAPFGAAMTAYDLLSNPNGFPVLAGQWCSHDSFNAVQAGTLQGQLKASVTPPAAQHFSGRIAAARRANVLGAYRAVSPERFAGRSVLLIDDILTTGATLSECSRVLLTAGASSVVCAALAATPEPGQKPADR